MRRPEMATALRDLITDSPERFHTVWSVFDTMLQPFKRALASLVYSSMRGLSARRVREYHFLLLKTDYLDMSDHLFASASSQGRSSLCAAHLLC
jgi:hypothetical protein